MNLLEKGVAWLDTQRQKMTRAVTYSRAAASVELQASIGQTAFRLDTGYGLSERYQSRDYLLPASALVLSGQSIEPSPGDRITETDAGKRFIYEVLAPGSEPCWKYADPFRRVLRIHTKLIAVEDA